MFVKALVRLAAREESELSYPEILCLLTLHRGLEELILSVEVRGSELRQVQRSTRLRCWQSTMINCSL